MTVKTYDYDSAELLDTPEAVETFMLEAFETGDAGFIAHALGIVARAKGMKKIASRSGLSREQLYRSFSEQGNPTLKTLLSVLSAMGFGITPVRRDPKPAT